MAIFLTGVGTGSILVSYNAVDLTDHVHSVTIDYSYDDKDITAMGATAHAHLPGLRDDTITVEFYQDYAASKVDVTINSFLGSTSGATLLVQSSGTTVSTTQPKWTLLGTPFTYQPIAGTVGEPSMTTIQFKPVAGQAIVRATS